MSTNDLNLISNYKKIIGLQNILSSSSGVTFIGKSTINSSLYISNNTIINNNLTLNSSLNVSNNTNIIQNLTTLSLINNNLLSNNISVNSNLLINGNNIISNNINISNISIITNSSSILSSLNVNDTVNIQNTLYLNNINLSTINAANINIGNPYSIIKINGTTISLLSNNLEVVDKYISLNCNTSSLGPIDIGNNCGLLISGISGDGFLRTNTTSTLFEMKAPLNNLNYPVILDSNNNLNITGTGLIYGNTTINSSLNISNNSIFNVALINNNLFISTFANLQNITLLSSLYISTFSIINNNTTINNNLYVSGSTNINSSITMLSNLVANDYYCNNVSLLSDLIISNNSILGESTILSNINCLSNNILTNVSINSNLTISAYTNLYNTTINSQLFILNNSTFNNNSTINSSLFCKENTIIKGNVNLGSTINNNITINSWIITPLLPEFMDNLSATLGGIPILGLYRTGDIVKIRAPYTIPTGLYFWIDATNLNSITKDVNNNITSIIDISGNNIVMENYVSRPKYKTNGINNLPILDLTNSSSMKSNNNYLNSLNVTIAVVTTFFQNTNWGCIWGHFNNSNTDIILEYNNNVAGYIHFQTNNDNSGCQIQYLPGVPVIFIGVLSNGISRYFKMINLNTGQEVYVTATNSLSMTLTNCPIRLGSSALTNELALCYIGEVLYWQRVLNSTDIYNVSQYLFNKWGLITATLSYIALPITLSLIGPAQNYILLNGTYTELGITINSITDPTLTPIITGSYDLTTLGSYTLTYTVNNGFNIVSITRLINIVSSMPPISYDTTNGNLQINSGLNFNALNNADWTIECWLYMNVIDNGDSSIIIDFRQPNQVNIPANHFWIQIRGMKPCIQNINNRSNIGSSINYTIPLNAWTHVTWMRKNNIFYSFINGIASPGESIPSYMNILSGLNYIVLGTYSNWVYGSLNANFKGQICQPLISTGAKYNITGFIPAWNLMPNNYSNTLFWMINGIDIISNQQIILNKTVLNNPISIIPVLPIITISNPNINIILNTVYTDAPVNISYILNPNIIPYITSIKDINGNELLLSPLNALVSNILSILDTSQETTYIITYSATTIDNVIITAIKTIYVKDINVQALNIIADWKSRIQNAGGSISSAEENAHLLFIIALLMDNTWDKILRLNTFCGNSTVSALCPIKNNSKILNNLGSINDTIVAPNPQYNRTGGFTGTGGAINTGLKFTAWSLDGYNMHLGLYAFTQLNGRTMGVWRGGVWERHFLISTGDSSGGAWGGSVSTNADSNSIGMNIIQCRNNESPYYYRRNIKTLITGNINHTMPADWPCTIFAGNGSGDGSNPSNAIYGELFATSSTRAGGYTMGYGLSDSQITTLTTAFDNLNIALSRS